MSDEARRLRSKQLHLRPWSGIDHCRPNLVRHVEATSNETCRVRPKRQLDCPTSGHRRHTQVMSDEARHLQSKHLCLCPWSGIDCCRSNHVQHVQVTSDKTRRVCPKHQLDRPTSGRCQHAQAMSDEAR